MSKRLPRLVAAAILVAVFVVLAINDRVVYKPDAYVLMQEWPPHVCAITWSDFVPMCNRGVALWLSKVGLSHGAEQQVAGAPIVDYGRSTAAKETCAPFKLIHIGGAGTTLAFDHWGILFVPQEVVGQPVREANGKYLTHVRSVAGFVVGNTYAICEVGSTLSIKADGHEYPGTVIQRWNN